jgi:hypothetical protein
MVAKWAIDEQVLVSVQPVFCRLEFGGRTSKWTYSGTRRQREIENISESAVIQR